jgi:hypothetical protein
MPYGVRNNRKAAETQQYLDVPSSVSEDENILILISAKTFSELNKLSEDYGITWSQAIDTLLDKRRLKRIRSF